MNIQSPVSTALDFSRSEFEARLNQVSQMILRRFDRLDGPAFCGNSPSEVASWFDELPPEDMGNLDALLERVEKQVMDTATLNIGPNMYAYVMAGGTQLSILAEMIVATLNQNVGKWHLAPVMTELERRVIIWAADTIGFAKEAAGTLVSGGSAANLQGLTVARNLFLQAKGLAGKGLSGQPPLVIYASEEVHSCVDKSAEMLGIGTDYLRKIPVDADYRILVDVLRARIEADKAAGLQPFCLIGNAGTVNTGAIDPLDELADIAEAHDLWFHVDGAYGGFPAMLPSMQAAYKGLDRADSVAIDFHKWLYQPFEAGCIIVREWSSLRKAWYKRATYLASDPSDDGRIDFNEHSFQLSRNAKALKIWMTYQYFGLEKLRAAIQNDIDNAAYLAELSESAPAFRCIHHGPLGITCFQYVPAGEYSEDQLNALNRALIPALEKDGRVFITGTHLKGQDVIRACCINHRQTRADMEHLLHVIRDVGEGMLRNAFFS
ncbi:MAG: pyridoxal-dependent decarboxylase [Bacteroidota bacterium]